MQSVHACAVKTQFSIMRSHPKSHKKNEEKRLGKTSQNHKKCPQNRPRNLTKNRFPQNTLPNHTFSRFGSKMTQNGDPFGALLEGNEHHFGDLCLIGALVGPPGIHNGGQGSPRPPKWSPKHPKWSPKHPKWVPKTIKMAPNLAAKQSPQKSWK